MFRRWVIFVMVMLSWLLVGCEDSVATPGAGAPPPSGAAAVSVAGSPGKVALAYLDGARSDSMVELRRGVYGRASNVNGFQVAGVTYYYQIVGHQSFDPWSRGLVDGNNVQVVETISSGAFTVRVYRIMNRMTQRP